jgi:hypothetical protein
MTPLATSGRRRAQVVGATVVVFVVGLLAILGWSQWHHSTSGVSAGAGGSAPVSGVVSWEGGPAVPVGSPPRVVKHALLVVSGTTLAGLNITRHATTNGLGRFQLRLPPGRYVITARVFGSPHSTIVVKRGQPIQLHIVEQVP